MLLIAGMGYVGRALAEIWDGEVLGVRRRAEEGAVSADLTDAEGLRRALGKRAIRTLVYCASADEGSAEAYRRAYVEGLGATLHALRDAPLERVIFTSSTGVYGQQEGEWVDEDTPTEPKRFSGEVLLEAESLLPECGIALRLAGIYGPGRTRMVRRVDEGSARSTPRFTNRIHRDDCAGALAHLLRREKPARVYLGVDDDVAPLPEVHAFLAHALGVEPPPREAGPLSKRCRNARLRASGYAPRFPSYRDGYPAIVAEYLASKTS